MLVNIPIIFYSSILASIINNETSHNAILASQPMMVLYCLPIAATILNRSERSPSELGRNICLSCQTQNLHPAKNTIPFISI